MSYQQNFLSSDYSIPFPQIKMSNAKFLKDNRVLNYTHFSIYYSIDRKAPICAAVNIDGKNFIPIKRKQDNWDEDPDVAEHQITDKFYDTTNAMFHRGHIVRRLDPCWGNQTDAAQGECDTFYFTNASPQHKGFNPKIWLELERAVLEKGAIHNDLKITVMSGPIIHIKDKPYLKTINDELIFIPSHYWKIVLWKKTDEKVYAVGFIQSQKDLIDNYVDQNYGMDKVRKVSDDYFEKLKFKDDAVYQVNISFIEKIGGLDFGFKKIGINTPKIENDTRELETKYIYEKHNEDDRFRALDESNSKIEIIGLSL